MIFSSTIQCDCLIDLYDSQTTHTLIDFHVSAVRGAFVIGRDVSATCLDEIALHLPRAQAGIESDANGQALGDADGRVSDTSIDL